MRKATANLVFRSFARPAFQPQSYVIFQNTTRHYADLITTETRKAEQTNKRKYEFINDETEVAGKIFKNVSDLAKDRIDYFIKENKIQHSNDLLPILNKHKSGVVQEHLNLLLGLYEKEGNYQKIKEIFNEFADSWGLGPDLKTFSIVVRATASNDTPETTEAVIAKKEADYVLSTEDINSYVSNANKYKKSVNVEHVLNVSNTNRAFATDETFLLLAQNAATAKDAKTLKNLVELISKDSKEYAEGKQLYLNLRKELLI